MIYAYIYICTFQPIQLGHIFEYARFYILQDDHSDNVATWLTLRIPRPECTMKLPVYACLFSHDKF